MENTKLVSGEIQHSSSKTRKCERLGLTNAKGPNQEIQVSAGTNPISRKANQSKLCEGSRSVICHMLHVTCIYWIITLTEKMMVHNHFDDQIMSKLSIRSTSWPNCQVAHKIVKWSIKWSIDFDIPLIYQLLGITMTLQSLEDTCTFRKNTLWINTLWKNTLKNKYFFGNTLLEIQIVDENFLSTITEQ